MEKLTIQQLEERIPYYARYTKDGNTYYTLNALIHTLKQYVKGAKTVCLSSEDGLCIPNISQTYICSAHIVSFIKITEIDNEFNAIFFEWCKHPTFGRYAV